MLTKEQIENWRKVLFGMFGSYALIMPESEIEKLKDQMQRRIDEIPDKGNTDVK